MFFKCFSCLQQLEQIPMTVLSSEYSYIDRIEGIKIYERIKIVCLILESYNRRFFIRIKKQLLFLENVFFITFMI